MLGDKEMQNLLLYKRNGVRIGRRGGKDGEVENVH
jgi:hypothetical protein